MSKPWGGKVIGSSWALESELAEADELAPPAESFPSLKEAATSSKPKKKKPVPIPLTQFVAATSSYDELLHLPTAPRERRPEDSERGFGGGYQRRGFEHDSRNAPQKSRNFEPDLPSRADEAGNWGAGKKVVSSIDRPRNERFGSLGGNSRADEIDNWGAGKKPMARNENVRTDKYGMLGGSTKADEVDNWGAGKKPVQPIQSFTGFSNGERKRLVLDPPKRNDSLKTESRSNVFGEARPREEVLAEKGLDWKKIDLEMESKTSRPSSAHSSRPGSSGSGTGGGRAKVNPFGDAKPREVVLKEKGMDWRKIDLELDHKRVDRPESDEEKMLKEEISALKFQVENAENGTAHISTEDVAVLHKQILEKERELELLTQQLDDKFKYGQRGAANIRPRSRSGASDDSRSSEFMERPQSRDRKQGYHGGFFADRNLERPKSRERW